MKRKKADVLVSHPTPMMRNSVWPGLRPTGFDWEKRNPSFQARSEGFPLRKKIPFLPSLTNTRLKHNKNRKGVFERNIPRYKKSTRDIFGKAFVR